MFAKLLSNCCPVDASYDHSVSCWNGMCTESDNTDWGSLAWTVPLGSTTTTRQQQAC